MKKLGNLRHFRYIVFRPEHSFTTIMLPLISILSLLPFHSINTWWPARGWKKNMHNSYVVVAFLRLTRLSINKRVNSRSRRNSIAKKVIPMAASANSESYLYELRTIESSDLSSSFAERPSMCVMLDDTVVYNFTVTNWAFQTYSYCNFM